MTICYCQLDRGTLVKFLRYFFVYLCVCCDKTFLGQDSTHIGVYRKPTTKPKYGYHQSSTWWIMSFIGVTYRNMGEGSCTGAEMTQRQLYHQGPPQHEWQLTNLETWSTLHSLQAAQQVGECPFRVTLPGSSAGFCFFRAAGLVAVFPASRFPFIWDGLWLIDWSYCLLW